MSSPWANLLPVLWRRQKGLCYFCRGRTLMVRDSRHIPGSAVGKNKTVLLPHRPEGSYRVATVEHVVRRSDGGSVNSGRNCVMACGHCNWRRNRDHQRRPPVAKVGG